MIVAALRASSPAQEPITTEPVARDNLLAQFFSHSAINEAMQDSWNDICSDTGCHPLDIEHGKGKILTFSPHHWANQIAKRLFVHAVKVHLAIPAPPQPVRDAVIEECVKAARDGFEDAMKNYVLIGPSGMAMQMINSIKALTGEPK
jgi:hypothetical protein